MDKKWVRIQLKDELHVQVRQEAVRRRLSWDVLMEQALKLWLAHQAQVNKAA